MMHRSLLEYAQAVLGQSELAEDCTWGHRMSVVLRLRDASGATWFLKQHRDRSRYRSELTAYRQWVPALGGKAPELHASDDSLQAMILSSVTGEPACWPASTETGPSATRSAEQVTQCEAGAILRRLHGAQGAVAAPGFAAAKMTEFDRTAQQAAGLLTARELNLARSHVLALAEARAPLMVPCHHDYTPRNWLVGGAGLHVIDFEWSGLDIWVADLARLHLAIWPARPDLRDAFLAGYGRKLTAADQRALRGCAALTAVWLVVRAHDTRQPSFEDASRAALSRLLAEA